MKLHPCTALWFIKIWPPGAPPHGKWPAMTRKQCGPSKLDITDKRQSRRDIAIMASPPSLLLAASNYLDCPPPISCLARKRSHGVCYVAFSSPYEDAEQCFGFIHGSFWLSTIFGYNQSGTFFKWHLMTTKNVDRIILVYYYTEKVNDILWNTLETSKSDPISTVSQNQHIDPRRHSPK